MADRPFRKPTPPPVYKPDGDTAFKCLTCGLVVVGTVCPKCGPAKPGGN